jgi:hypothetical protein
MTFDEVLAQTVELQQRSRVTYRSLKRRFNLDDEYLEDLKGELIRAEDSKVNNTKRATCWLRSTTGLPKALTRKICKTRRRYSKV